MVEAVEASTNGGAPEVVAEVEDAELEPDDEPDEG